MRGPTGRVLFPPLVRVSVARLNPAGAYLLENGQCMFLWLGRDIPSNYLMDVFGVSTLDEVDPSLVSFSCLLVVMSPSNGTSSLSRQFPNQRFFFFLLPFLSITIAPSARN